MILIRNLLITCCLFLTVTPMHANADTTQLLTEVIKAYGGEEAWRNAGGFTQKGRTYSGRLQVYGKTERNYAHPLKMRIETVYDEDDFELHQLDGDTAWSSGKQALKTFADIARLQSYRLAPPLLMIEHGDKAKDLGSRKDGPNTRRGVMFDLGDGMQVLVDIDEKSKHVAGAWGILERDGRRMEHSTLYEDHRQVDGKLVAFKETHYVMGGYIGHTELQEVEFSTEFAADTFSPTP